MTVTLWRPEIPPDIANVSFGWEPLPLKILWYVIRNSRSKAKDNCKVVLTCPKLKAVGNYIPSVGGSVRSRYSPNVGL